MDQSSKVYELQLTKEHYEEIGKIVVNFQKLEFKLNQLLGVFIHTNFLLSPHSFRVNALLHEIGFSSKLGTLQSIINGIESFQDIADIFPQENYKHKDSLLEDITKLSQVLKNVRKCMEIRNKYVHSQWIDGGMCSKKEQAVGRYKITAKGKKIKGELLFESPEDLAKHNRFFQKTYSDLKEYSTLLECLSHTPSENQV